MADCYTDLEKAVAVLVENFYKYVSEPSLVENKISKKSFQKMVQKELNHMLTNTGNPKAAEKLFQDLDTNHDRSICFDEYWTMIGNITRPLVNFICPQECQQESHQEGQQEQQSRS